MACGKSVLDHCEGVISSEEEPMGMTTDLWI